VPAGTAGQNAETFLKQLTVAKKRDLTEKWKTALMTEGLTLEDAGANKSNIPAVQPSALLRPQIRIFAIQFVVFKGNVDVLITLHVPPGGALIDEFILCIRASGRTQDISHLFFRHVLVDLVEVNSGKFGVGSARVIAANQYQCKT
jgi:hypothetical protein